MPLLWQAELVAELTAAAPIERKHILAKYEERTGFIKQHLYRIAKEHGWASGNKQRTDRGVLRSGLNTDHVEFVAALLYETGRDNKGPIMPVERAIQIAEDNGIIEPGQISPATMNRILRERQISKMHQKAETPHTEMRSLHPNHVHLVDVSVCIQYYLKNGRMGIMDERDFYKNKPQNFAKIKTRLLRYVIDDHFSGAYYFKYYNTTGETQANLYDFLKEAWAHKQDERFPFRGVPFQMLMDTGAANTSKAIVAFMRRLDINIPKGMPYNPRRQGAVETTHKIIEEWFESGLRLQPAHTVEELNAWARDFMIWHQAVKKHTRHEMTRTACWMLITQAQIRELPADDLLQDCYALPEEERTVSGSYSISFRGNEYNLKHVEALFRGAKVMAILKPFKWPIIDILYNGKIYEVKPLEILPAYLGGFRADAAIIGQEYKAQPETMTQQAIKRFENMAYGEKKKKDAIPFEGLRVHGIHADKVGNLAFIEKKGTPIEVDRGIASRKISFVEFLKRLIRQVGPITKEMNQQLRSQHGDSIETSTAEEVIRQIETGQFEIRSKTHGSSEFGVKKAAEM